MNSSAARLLSPHAIRAFAVPVGILLLVLAGFRWHWIAQFPGDWTLPVSAGINVALDWIIPGILPLTSAASHALGIVLSALVGTLQFLPWPAVTLAIMLIGLKAGGLRLLVLCLGAFVYIVLVGFWR